MKNELCDTVEQYLGWYYTYMYTNTIPNVTIHVVLLLQGVHEKCTHMAVYISIPVVECYLTMK